MPPDSLNAQSTAQNLVLGNGQKAPPEVNPYANDLLTATPTADVVELTVVKGTVRLADPTEGFDRVFDGGAALCTLANGCVCPGHAVFDGYQEPGK